MKNERKQALSKKTTMIAEDMERDMVEMEGKPFNGKEVAKQFGNQAAAIATLAGMIKEIIEDEERA